MSLPWLTPVTLLKSWEHVRENHGCAGVDGVTVDHFADAAQANLDALMASVEANRYRPLPLLPITVQKKPDSMETRTLLVPCVRDRVLQTAAGRHLGHAFEDDFLDCSFAYRPHRSVNSAVARIRYLHDHGFKFVAEADIESFFDRIDHDLLRQRLRERIEEPELCDLLDAWIGGDVWDGQKTTPITAGVPQGSPISPLLANFFLSDFDLSLEEAGLKLIRYADDFLILARDRANAAAGLEIARRQLDRLHLTLKDSKTHIAAFDDGFHFLGVFFLGRGIWIPWEHNSRNRRVLSIPRPMPAVLVARWLAPPVATEMGRALMAARHRPIMTAPCGASATEDDNMAYLYLTEQGSVLRKIGDRLVVEKEDVILLDTPYHKLEAVMIFGNIQITTQAMAELLDAGIPVSLLRRDGVLRGSLDPPQGKNILLRLGQFDVYRDPGKAMALARLAVAAKLANSAAVLASFGDREQSRSAATVAAVRQITASQESAMTAPSLDILNGVEGAAAKLYFATIMHRNKSVFEWPGRVRHPATDAINSLLSFGYTLVGNEIAAFLETAGLDSYLGCLHQIDYGRRSLALDLVEAFRAPFVDRMVLTMLNRRQFAPDDFDHRDGGAMYLKADSSKRFLAEYERWMLHGAREGESGFRIAIRAAVQSYAAAIRESNPDHYKPFLYKPSADGEEGH